MKKKLHENKFNFNIEIEPEDDIAISKSTENSKENQIKLSKSKNVVKSQIDAYATIMDDMVDLHLPSGKLWARYNVGVNSKTVSLADNVESWCGNYYAWGETKKYYPFGKYISIENNTNKLYKPLFNWSTYKYSNGEFNKLTKYCTKRLAGNNFFKDNLTTLEYEDDIVRIDALNNRKRKRKIPTVEDFKELIENTNAKLVESFMGILGLSGLVLQSKSSWEDIFFPIGGMRYYNKDGWKYLSGYYWCSSIDNDYPYLANGFCFGSYEYRRFDNEHNPVIKNEYSDKGSIKQFNRYKGFFVRGISD